MTTKTNSSHHDHERRDVDVPIIVLIVLTLFLSGALIFLIVAGMMRSFGLKEPSKTSGAANIPGTLAEPFPQPRLIVRPGADLAVLRAAEESDLNSYGWIDHNSGTVRIPIDRAMQLLLERGLPEVGAGQTPLSLMQARPNEMAAPPQPEPQP